MVWYRSKQGTTQNASLHCLHKYRLSFRCSCLWQTMQRRVGLSFVSVGGISIKKCPSVRRKGFPSKLVLPPLRSTDDFTTVPYFTTICLTNFVRKFNAFNLPPFFLCMMWVLNEDMFIKCMKCFLCHFFIRLRSVYHNHQLFKTLQISIDVYQLSMYTQCLLCNLSSISVINTLIAR